MSLIRGDNRNFNPNVRVSPGGNVSEAAEFHSVAFFHSFSAYALLNGIHS